MALDLKVCDKCGWYEHGRHRADRCNPSAGKAVDSLMSAIPEVSATKLGYGDDNFVFTPDGPEAATTFNIRFSVQPRREEPFRLEGVWLLNHLSHEDAEDLVKTLVEWRKRCAAR